MRHILLIACTIPFMLAAQVAYAAEPVAIEKNEPAPKAKKHGKKKVGKNTDDTDSVKADKADAQPTDSELPGDSRIKLLMYDEADVYTITTRYGYQTNIVFAPTEEIELISVGDRSLWQIIPSGNRMFIRPMEEDVTTNMTVLTNKHSYQFDLKSVPGDKTTGNIYVAKFIYDAPKKMIPTMDVAPFTPAAAPVVAAPVQTQALMTNPAPVAVAPAPSSSPFGIAPSIPQHATVEAQPPAPTPLPFAPAQSSMPAATYPNYNYTYTGSDSLAPLQVYDDGKVTYLKYASTAGLLPSTYVVKNGQETPVSYTVRDNMLIVEAIAGELTVKNRDAVIHVYNETLNPG